MIFVNGGPTALTRLGAAPRSITEVGPPLEAKRGQFTDHPLIAVGPFTFNPAGQRMEIVDGVSLLANPNGPHMQFLLRGLADASTSCESRIPGPSIANIPGPPVPVMRCYAGGQRGLPQTYRGWGYKGAVLNTQGSVFEPWGFSEAAIKGAVPLYRVENPLEGGKWGVYITRKEHSTVVEFKPIPEGVWAKIFGWIETIIGVIIDTIRALFDFLGVVACAMGRQYLGQLASLATGDVMGAALSAGTVGWLTNNAGVTEGEISSLASGVNSSLAQSIADRVVNAACGAAEGYPAGTFAVFDPASNQYLILVPNA